LAKFKITLVGNTREPRIIEADDCGVYDGACTFTTKVPSSYKDWDTNEQVPCERDALVVSFAPGSWLTVEKEGYY